MCSLGSFAVEAAEEVAGADVDVLSSLVDKSLLRPLQGGRFFYLEPIRELALEGLRATGGEAELRSRVAGYLLRVLPQSPTSVRAEHVEWYLRVGADFENVRATVAWLIDQERYADALRLVNATARYLESRAVEEAYRWCMAAFTDRLRTAFARPFSAGRRPGLR